jgi:hypothetical protein
VDLPEFVLARVAEAEADARLSAEVNPPPWHVHLSQMGGDTGLVMGGETPANRYRDGALWDNEGADSLSMEPATATHIARHDPARVLAWCAAMRAIVERLGWPYDWPISGAMNELEEDVLRLLAQIWADHPDFDPSWR